MEPVCRPTALPRGRYGPGRSTTHQPMRSTAPPAPKNDMTVEAAANVSRRNGALRPRDQRRLMSAATPERTVGSRCPYNLVARRGRRTSGWSHGAYVECCLSYTLVSKQAVTRALKLTQRHPYFERCCRYSFALQIVNHSGKVPSDT